MARFGWDRRERRPGARGGSAPLGGFCLLRASVRA